MNILYIGAGFVGACSAAVSAESGHKTLVYDINATRIDLLSSDDKGVIESCLSEPGLGELLIRNKERINFTSTYSDVENFVSEVDAIFVCVPTPEVGETGESDLKYFYSALETVCQALALRNNKQQEKYVLLVNKSTLPIDMPEKTQAFMEKAGVKNFGIVSNPEFLVMGKAVQNSLQPDRVVVGAWSEQDFKIMRRVYAAFHTSARTQYIEVNPKEAAAGKLLANFYLFNKVANCFDVLGRTCESFTDLKFEQVRNILSSDPRIGGWGFLDSLYAGGSCLIKDSRSLLFQLESTGKNVNLIQETYTANKRQLEHFMLRAEQEAGFVWEQKKVALLGLAFKSNTNDVRDSAAVKIAEMLLSKNIKALSVYDPIAMDNFEQKFSSQSLIEYADSEKAAIQDADVIIVCSDWSQFRGLSDMILQLGKKPLIMDGSRILESRYEELANKGYNIIAVGSPFMGVKN